MWGKKRKGNGGCYGQHPVNDGHSCGRGATFGKLRLFFCRATLLSLSFFLVILFGRQQLLEPAEGGRCGDIMSIAGQGERKRDREEERKRKGGREEEGARGGETGSRLPPGQLRMLVVSRNRINHRTER